MLGVSTSSNPEFVEALTDVILSTLKGKKLNNQIAQEIENAGRLLEKGAIVDLSSFTVNYNGQNYSLGEILVLIQKQEENSTSQELISNALETWKNQNLILMPLLPQRDSLDDFDETVLDTEKDTSLQDTSSKEYIKRDNRHLYTVLSQEFKSQAIGNEKSTYAWKFKSGQNNLNKANEINLFFLGTSTPPLFGIHDKDVCETGHVICQAALQKAQQGAPTLLVKGIATVDMDPSFPLDALNDTSIRGVFVDDSLKQYVRKQTTTVVGTGAETRLDVAMNQYFIPNLFKMLNERSLDNRDELIINIAGHSRGGITSFIAADCINEFIEVIANGKEGVDYSIADLAKNLEMDEEEVRRAVEDIKANQAKLKIKVCALDPVEGARSMEGLNVPFMGSNSPRINVPIKGLKKAVSCSYESMPERVTDAFVFLANDERRSGFRPTIPTFSGNTRVMYKREHGKHGGLTGNLGNDSGNGQFNYETFKDNPELQDAMLGIFDETLSTINEFFAKDNGLPPFPRNTIRRIFRQGEYSNTKALLLEALKNDGVVIGNHSEDELIEAIESRMLSNPTLNIVFYEMLKKDAQKALENQKKGLLSLEKEWRRDSNISALLDRDPWESERRVYIRGQKIRGTIKWHEFNLTELAPKGLPDSIYYGANQDGMPFPFNKENEALLVEFNRLKSKINFLANNRSGLSKEDIIRSLQEDIANLKLMVNEKANKMEQPLPHEFLMQVTQMCAELFIDLDHRHHLLSSDEVMTLFEGIMEKNLLEYVPEYCILMQYSYIHAYIGKNDLTTLSPEEIEALAMHVEMLKERMMHYPQVEQFRNAHIYLDELIKRLELRAELDQYIELIGDYISSKSTMTGQDTIEIKALVEKLEELRLNINQRVASESRAEMEVLLKDYKEKKGFQNISGQLRGYLVGSLPGSVVCINDIEKKIDEKKVTKAIRDIHHHPEFARLVESDLDNYIKVIEDYRKSKKLSENDTTLLEQLKALKEQIGTIPISEIDEEMQMLTKKYIQDNPHAESRTTLGSWMGVRSATTCAGMLNVAFEGCLAERQKLVKQQLSQPKVKHNDMK